MRRSAISARCFSSRTRLLGPAASRHPTRTDATTNLADRQITTVISFADRNPSQYSGHATNARAVARGRIDAASRRIVSTGTSDSATTTDTPLHWCQRPQRRLTQMLLSDAPHQVVSLAVFTQRPLRQRRRDQRADVHRRIFPSPLLPPIPRILRRRPPERRREFGLPRMPDRAVRLQNTGGELGERRPQLASRGLDHFHPGALEFGDQPRRRPGRVHDNADGPVLPAQFHHPADDPRRFRTVITLRHFNYHMVAVPERRAYRRRQLAGLSIHPERKRPPAFRHIHLPGVPELRRDNRPARLHRRILADRQAFLSEPGGVIDHRPPLGGDVLVADPDTHPRVVVRPHLRVVQVDPAGQVVVPLTRRPLREKQAAAVTLNPVVPQRPKLRRPFIPSGRRIPDLRIRPRRQRRQHRPDSLILQFVRLIHDDQISGEPATRRLRPGHKPETLTILQRHRLLAGRAVNVLHPLPQRRVVLDPRFNPQERFLRCLELMRRMEDQVHAEIVEEQRRQRQRLEDRALPVLPGNDQRNLKRRPLPISPAPQRLIKNPFLPRVKTQPRQILSQPPYARALA